MNENVSLYQAMEQVRSQDRHNEILKEISEARADEKNINLNEHENIAKHVMEYWNSLDLKSNLDGVAIVMKSLRTRPEDSIKIKTEKDSETLNAIADNVISSTQKWGVDEAFADKIPADDYWRAYQLCELTVNAIEEFSKKDFFYQRPEDVIEVVLTPLITKIVSVFGDESPVVAALVTKGLVEKLVAGGYFKDFGNGAGIKEKLRLLVSNVGVDDKVFKNWEEMGLFDEEKRPVD